MIGEAVGVREARPPDLGGSRSGIGTAAMPPAVTVAERRQVRPVATRAVRSALQQAAGTEGPGRRDKGASRATPADTGARWPPPPSGGAWVVAGGWQMPWQKLGEWEKWWLRHGMINIDW